jgi:putative ABC transport system permease protein
MKFVLQMAWRDSRASRRRLVLFALSIVLGIGALIATGSFCANLRQAIETQANGLLGADLVVTTFETPAPDLLRHLDGLGGERAHEQVFGAVATFPTAAARARMVQVHVLQGNFPFYGEFVTRPVDALARLRQGGAVAILDASLLEQFAVRPGDPVQLGKSQLTILGALERTTFGAPIEAMLVPRVYVPAGALAGSGLDEKVKRRRHLLAVKLAPERDTNAIAKDLADRFPDAKLSFATAAERRRELEKALPNIDRFLSLVGFVALLLGSVGVASSLQVYVSQKLATVAVLRCLGASVQQSFLVYLVQGLALGVVGAGLGAVAGVALQWIVPFVLRDLIPLRIDFFLVWAAIGRGVAAGLIMSLLFSLAPLLEVRRVSPLMVLRTGFDGGRRAPDPWRVALGVVIVLATTAFALWQAPVWQVGAGFVAMLAFSFSVLAGVAKLVAWAARRWFPRRAPYVARQGLANLYRPHNRTVLLLLSLGMGTFLILTPYLTRTSLVQHIRGPDGGGLPNVILTGIREEQFDALKKLIPAQGARVAQTIPVLKTKITAVRGRTRAEMTKLRGERWANAVFSRTYDATFRAETADGERVVEGEFIGRARPGTPVVPVMIDQNLLRMLRVQLDDEIVWEVQGVPIRTRVTAVRGWEIPRLTPDFRIIFPAGALDGAPKTWVATVLAPGESGASRVQREVRAAFPNVQIIDITFIVETLDRIFAKIAFVIEFLALSIVATGLIMLVCAVLTGRYQRIRESVLLRTLGATRRQLQRIQFIEYAILGVLGAFVGCLLAVLANVLLARHVFHTTPQAPVLQVLAAFGLVTSITLLTGWLANRGVTDHPPLAVLRQET